MIRRLVEDQRVRELSDEELLQRFTAQQDEPAFQALLGRHGAMVLDVCRGLLRNEADAEDAFQATCLILAREGGRIRRGTSLGSWLHAVAYRIGLRARALSATRQKHESYVPQRQASEPDDLSWREVRQVVHEELNGLPERYRAPLVLCYLEGATQDAAAVQLRVAKSTLRERLERCRMLLRMRLIRRGLGPTALVVALAWPAAQGSANVPTSVLTSTLKAVVAAAAGHTTGVLSAKIAALTKGGLQTMFPTKLKSALALVLVAGISALGVVTLPGAGLTQGEPAVKQPAVSTLPTVAEMTRKLGARQKKFKSRWVECAVTTKTGVDPTRLMSWGMQTIKDFKFTSKVAFAADRRCEAKAWLKQELIQPPDEVGPDPLAPEPLERQIQRTQDLAKKAKAAGGQVTSGGMTMSFSRKVGALEYESVYDGRAQWVSRNGSPFMMTVDGAGSPRFSGQLWFLGAPYFSHSYLEGVWLRPPSPLAADDQLKAEQAHRLPDCLEHLANTTVARQTEAVDGSACVVLRAERNVKRDNDSSWESRYFGKNRIEVLTWWLDPALGYAPRRSEVRIDGLLVYRWDHSQFAELAPDCWLPRESRWTRGTPAWVEKELRDKSAFSQTYKVTAWRVNDVPEGFFRIAVNPATRKGNREINR
jgi:RNA polymerase sigma factor (sigma-70 family)